MIQFFFGCHHSTEMASSMILLYLHFQKMLKAGLSKWISLIFIMERSGLKPGRSRLSNLMESSLLHILNLTSLCWKRTLYNEKGKHVIHTCWSGVGIYLHLISKMFNFVFYKRIHTNQVY